MPSDPTVTRCSAPTGCSQDKPFLRMDNLGDAVRIICNNSNCQEGRFMHKDCFEEWESTVLSCLRSCGRARSWSEKQRLQNLWTKKGYDLVYKACGCKCGKGHLKKDLDWVPSLIPGLTSGDGDDESGKKKKKKNRGKKSNVPSTPIASSPPGKDKGPLTTSSSSNVKNNSTSSPSSCLRRQSSSDASTSSGVSSLSSSSSSSGNNNHKSNSGLNSHPSSSATSCSGGRNRTFSMSSTGSAGNNSGGASPPIFEGNCSEISSVSSQSPDLVVGQSASVKRLFFGESDRNIPSYSRSNSLNNNNQSYHSKYNLGNNSSFSGRERSLSGTMFGRRHDYSTFNILPRSKINSYHIRMEDETSHGNDDIRTLILSTLSANGMNRVNCILCQGPMTIFEKFPLIDGTFFLSPRQHAKSAVPLVTNLVSTSSTIASLVNSPEKKYLNAVCMGCLEGWNCVLKCRGCNRRWDGSHLILGSMYAYDIFAAIPCCISRLRCNNCSQLVISSSKRLEFFSEFSQSLSCASCGVKDFHFVKPLPVTFIPGGKRPMIHE